MASRQRFALNEIDWPRVRLPEEATEPPGLTPEDCFLRPLPIAKLFDASSIESSISLRSGAETRGWSLTFSSAPAFTYYARY